jgi:hypothetical protein
MIALFAESPASAQHITAVHTDHRRRLCAGATGASAPAQFLQRGLSPLTYDAARDGRGGREGGRGSEVRGREGRRRGGTFSPRTFESN